VVRVDVNVNVASHCDNGSSGSKTQLSSASSSSLSLTTPLQAYHFNSAQPTECPSTASCRLKTALSLLSIPKPDPYYKGTNVPKDGWFQPCKMCRCWTGHTVQLSETSETPCCKRCEPAFWKAEYSQKSRCSRRHMRLTAADSPWSDLKSCTTLTAPHDSTVSTMASSSSCTVVQHRPACGAQLHPDAPCARPMEHTPNSKRARGDQVQSAVRNVRARCSAAQWEVMMQKCEHLAPRDLSKGSSYSLGQPAAPWHHSHPAAGALHLAGPCTSEPSLHAAQSPAPAAAITAVQPQVEGGPGCIPLDLASALLASARAQHGNAVADSHALLVQAILHTASACRRFA